MGDKIDFKTKITKGIKETLDNDKKVNASGRSQSYMCGHLTDLQNM